ncbi:hypothetical protein [Sphingomonas azotifigens]|uniref:hypothetical protein n=1 Tax=Sphingomonas azotifigens TaxID=330920 RepID=UPI0009FF5235|nr:hypothetical protein [Sphingomonas azotifigens]
MLVTATLPPSSIILALRALGLKQANLVGAAGYISMEDTEATELVQQGTVRDPDATSVIEVAGSIDWVEDGVGGRGAAKHFTIGAHAIGTSSSVARGKGAGTMRFLRPFFVLGSRPGRSMRRADRAPFTPAGGDRAAPS